MHNIIILFVLTALFSSITIPSTPDLPEIITISEMKPFPEKILPNVITLAPEINEKFNIQWILIRDIIEKNISPDTFYNLSNWAKEETKNFVPSLGWIRQIPMDSVKKISESNCVLFFQDTEKGIPLPSHSSIVFRRIVVAVLYDLENQSIRKVYITIRGWREE